MTTVFIFIKTNLVLATSNKGCFSFKLGIFLQSYKSIFDTKVVQKLKLTCTYQQYR